MRSRRKWGQGGVRSHRRVRVRHRCLGAAPGEAGEGGRGGCDGCGLLSCAPPAEPAVRLLLWGALLVLRRRVGPVGEWEGLGRDGRGGHGGCSFVRAVLGC